MSADGRHKLVFALGAACRRAAAALNRSDSRIYFDDDDTLLRYTETDVDRRWSSA
jgi:hypothetical protein